MLSFLQSILLLFSVTYVILKIYIKLSTGWCCNKVCLINKTAIITGSNTGIGYETALEFAKRGCRVILACRDLSKADAAKKRIIEQTYNPNIIVKHLDLTSLESVRAFAEDINETEERLDILVNNAGIATIADRHTIDNLQEITQVNYFAPFLLTLLLINKLKKSPSSRIINVSSIGAKWAKPQTINNLTSYHGSKGYMTTKLFNILFTKELAIRLEKTNITTYSLHPGLIKTEILRHLDGVLGILMNTIVSCFSKIPEEGAQTTIYLATESDIEHFNGEHFHDCKRVDCYRAASDAHLARKLWEKTEELVKLKREENPF